MKIQIKKNTFFIKYTFNYKVNKQFQIKFYNKMKNLIYKIFKAI